MVEITENDNFQGYCPLRKRCAIAENFTYKFNYKQPKWLNLTTVVKFCDRYML